MTTITLPKNALPAALICAGNQDMRYYLNGVMLRATAAGRLYVVSTDGCRAFVGKIDGLIEPGAAPFEVIVPRETIVAAVKLAGTRVKTLELVVNAQCSLGGVPFLSIDGKFPDMDVVIPTNCSGDRANYNWQYVVDARKAPAIWAGVKETAYYGLPLQMNGMGVAVMAIDTAFCLVIPFRVDVGAPFPTFKLGN